MGWACKGVDRGKWAGGVQPLFEIETGFGSALLFVNVIVCAALVVLTF